MTPSELSTPDFNAPNTCRRRGREVPRSPQGPSPRTRKPIEGSIKKTLDGRWSSINETDKITSGQYAYAINWFSCAWPTNNCSTTSPGFTKVMTTLSSQVPSLYSGETWNTHHYVNRVHVVHPSYTVTCNGETDQQTASIVLAYGNVGGVVWSNRLLTEKYIVDRSNYTICLVIDSGITVNPPGALFVDIYWSSLSNEWVLRTWLGQWVVLDYGSTNWSVAASVNVGQELWASDPAKIGSINVPVNFVHKLTIEGTDASQRPWHDNVLPSQLSGHSRSIADQPFHVMDLSGSDFTSISSCVHC